MATNSAINSNQTLDTVATPTFATCSLSTSGLTLLTATSTDAGAAAGPIADLYRNSASPAAADILGQVIYNGVDSGAAKQEYARMEARIISTTAASEKGALAFYTMATGTATKQIDLLDTGGQYRGNNTNTAPPAGYIGERLSSFIPIASQISLTTATAADITSLSITAGIWDLTFIAIFNTGGAFTGTDFEAWINTTSATAPANSTIGDQRNLASSGPTSSATSSVIVPIFRVSLASTTTYYATVQGAFTVGTLAAFGRFSAIRVG